MVPTHQCFDYGLAEIEGCMERPDRASCGMPKSESPEPEISYSHTRRLTGGDELRRHDKPSAIQSGHGRRREWQSLFVVVGDVRGIIT